MSFDNWDKYPRGACVRIRGGMMATPEGRGVRWETPEPAPEEIKGTLGVLRPFKPKSGLNLTHMSPYPFEPWKSQILREEAERLSKDLSVVEIIEGPLKGTLLNRDMLDFEILSPLEMLADQAD
jgi:hypothetical protein